MAKLPSEYDLQRRPTPDASPEVTLRAPDLGIAEQGARAVGEGGQNLGQGVAKLGALQLEQQRQTEAYELQRRLVDFKLDAEMAQEDHKRAMPPGGAGYAVGWNEEFDRRAKGFVGASDANVPKHLRPRVGYELTKIKALLSERAQREEWGERDRKTRDDLEQTLGRLRSTVEVDPNRLDEMHATGADLIEQAPITPAQRQVVRKKLRETLEETAATALADRIIGPDGSLDRERYATAKSLLAPGKPDRVSAKGVAFDLKASVKGNEGFKAEAYQDHKQWSIGYGTRARHQGETITREEAERRLDSELSAAEKLVDQFAPGLPAGTRAALTSLTYNAGSGWMKDGLGQAVKAGDEAAIRERFLLYTQASGKTLPGLVKRRQEEAEWIGRGAGATPGGTDGTAPDDAYDGPFASLPLAKRRAIWARAEGQIDKAKKGVELIIKEQGGLTYPPPAPLLDALGQRVKAFDDPLLTAQFDAMQRNVAATRVLAQMTPAELETYGRALAQQRSGSGSTTKELDSAIAHVEKLTDQVRKATNNDPMAHAARSGMAVAVGPSPAPAETDATVPNFGGSRMAPLALEKQGVERRASLDVAGDAARASFTPAPIKLDRLDFNAPTIGETLSWRMQQSLAVGRRLGQPPQVFTTTERDALKDSLKVGGKPLLHTLGQIVKAAERHGIDPAHVMKELSSKDAPEIAVIGEMVGSNSDPVILDTAAKAVAWRTQMGEKFISTIDKAQVKADLGAYADVLATTPHMVDAVRQTANLVYEYEARKAGKQTFDDTLYQTVVRRVMGEVESAGTLYGGVGRQGRGWFDGKWSSGWGGTPKVHVPSVIRQDGFDDMVAAIRLPDLAADPPRDGDGKPLAVGVVRGAIWVSLGRHHYALQLGRDAAGRPQLATNADGSPYALDIRPLLPAIRRRRPDIFLGYTGAEPTRPEPDDGDLPVTNMGALPAQAMR